MAECDRRRAAFQDQQAAGLMTLDELGSRLRGLDEERAVAERELGRLRDTQRRIEELEANKEAVLRMFGTGLLVGIEWFPPNLRRAVYELLATRVTVCGDRTLTIEANLDANPVRHTKGVEEYVEGLRGIEERVSEAGALGTQEWIELVERELFALQASLSDRTDTEEPEMVKMEEEVRGLSDEELDRMLASRLDLPYPVDAEVLDRSLARVEEPERLSRRGPGGFTGAPDMSHEACPEERPGDR